MMFLHEAQTHRICCRSVNNAPGIQKDPSFSDNSKLSRSRMFPTSFMGTRFSRCSRGKDNTNMAVKPNNAVQMSDRRTNREGLKVTYRPFFGALLPPGFA